MPELANQHSPNFFQSYLRHSLSLPLINFLGGTRVCVTMGIFQEHFWTWKQRFFHWIFSTWYLADVILLICYWNIKDRYYIPDLVSGFARCWENRAVPLPLFTKAKRPGKPVLIWELSYSFLPASWSLVYMQCLVFIQLLVLGEIATF